MIYQRLARTTAALLTRLGQGVTVRRQTLGAYDPATGAAAPVIQITSGIPAAVFAYVDADIDGTLIQRGDKRVLMSPTFEPVKGDVVTIGSVEHTVISVRSNEPAGTPVLYTVQVRA